MDKIAPDSFPLVFSRLCHMVVLSRDEQVEAVIDDVVLTAVITSSGHVVADTEEAKEAVEGYFGIRLEDRAVQSSISRLIESGRLLAQKNQGFLAAPHVCSATETKITNAYELEEQVKTEWLDELARENEGWKAEWGEQFWNALKAYMAKAFMVHGAETTLLLNPSAYKEDVIESKLSGYLSEAVAQECSPAIVDAALRSISEFFVQDTPSRTKYLAQLLDGTFTFFALNLDEQTSEYLRGEMTPLKLFLDTNFLYSLIGLRSNQYDEFAQELVDTIRDHNLPFSLHFHSVTLRELEDTIQSHATRLRSHSWPQGLSRAIVGTAGDEINGLEYAYHQRNAQSPLSLDAFLARFDSVYDLLTDEHQLGLYNDTQETNAQRESRQELCGAYQEYLSKVRYKSKPYPAINHDMKLVQTVQYLRTNGSSILNADALLVTLDRYLWRFDWQELRGFSRLGFTVLPTQLLQLLRPLMRHNPDFDRRFVETFSIPEFRTARQFPSVTSKVIEYLSAFDDISEHTARRLLANTVMKERLQEVVDKDDEFISIIEQTLLDDNERLAMERDHSQQETRLAREESESKENALREAEAKARQSELRIHEVNLKLSEKDAQNQASAAEAQKAIEQMSSRVQQLEEQLEQQDLDKLKRRERLVQTLKWVLGILILLAGFFAIFVLPQRQNWEWFLSHPRKLGLQVAATVTIVLLSGIFVYPQHRKKLIVSGLFAVLLTAIQII
ncbi:MAG: hypothetical protein KDD92_04325 [Caldilineaceae bacterium]|nr:hypothetical protein [Caldilineaceae bacterium]